MSSEHSNTPADHVLFSVEVAEITGVLEVTMRVLLLSLSELQEWESYRLLKECTWTATQVNVREPVVFERNIVPFCEAKEGDQEKADRMLTEAIAWAFT